MRASAGATAWVWWVCGMLLLADRLDLDVASREAGRYVVRVERTSDDGTPALVHLQVVVGE